MRWTGYVYGVGVGLALSGFLGWCDETAAQDGGLYPRIPRGRAEVPASYQGTPPPTGEILPLPRPMNNQLGPPRPDSPGQPGPHAEVLPIPRPMGPAQPPMPPVPGQPGPGHPPHMGMPPGSDPSLAGPFPGGPHGPPCDPGCPPVHYFGCDETPLPCGPTIAPPGMIGALAGYSYTSRITVQDVANATSFEAIVAGAPIPGRVAFRIAENESPVPQHRAFLTYNFLHNLNKKALNRRPENDLIANTRLISNIDLHYQTLGFEHPFCCNRFSVGVRVPMFQLQEEEGSGGQGDTNAAQEQPRFLITRGLDQASIGDVSVVLKGVLAYDPIGNSVLSGGVVLTAPTAPNTQVFIAALPPDDQTADNSNPALIQPFLGYFVDFKFAYVHGFTSIVIPTDNNDVTLLLNDIGVGFLLWNFAAPTVEVHWTTPLGGKGSQFNEPIGAINTIILTGGVHFAFYGSSTLTVGGATPLSGSTFDVQAVCQLNVRF